MNQENIDIIEQVILEEHIQLSEKGVKDYLIAAIIISGIFVMPLLLIQGAVRLALILWAVFTFTHYVWASVHKHKKRSISTDLAHEGITCFLMAAAWYLATMISSILERNIVEFIFVLLLVPFAAIIYVKYTNRRVLTMLRQGQFKPKRFRSLRGAPGAAMGVSGYFLARALTPPDLSQDVVIIVITGLSWLLGMMLLIKGCGYFYKYHLVQKYCPGLCVGE